MPELPEVETVRRVLSNNILDLKILDIDIRYPNIIEDNLDYFKNNIINKKIKSIDRLGKFLIFNLDDGAFISHLRMEGKYYYLKKDSIDNKHIHVIFNFDNGYSLYYQDVRKFGRMIYKKSDEIYTTKPLKDVGIDPILNKKIDYRNIYDKIVLRSVSIKTTLLDQSIICGLGNIYVDEVLFLSKINPHRLSHDIKYDEVVKIVDNTIKVLSKAIEYKGTTIKSYTSSLNVYGEYQQFLNVHTKTTCPVCHSPLLKDKINGRSTYYCKNCEV